MNKKMDPKIAEKIKAIIKALIKSDPQTLGEDSEIVDFILYPSTGVEVILKHKAYGERRFYLHDYGVDLEEDLNKTLSVISIQGSLNVFKNQKPSTRIEPPWDELDNGIRWAVQFVWKNGFQPTDSGDGSKAAYMEGALGYPHVFIQLDDPLILISEVDRLTNLLKRYRGCENPWVVEGNYSAGGPAMIILMAVEAHIRK